MEDFTWGVYFLSDTRPVVHPWLLSITSIASPRSSFPLSIEIPELVLQCFSCKSMALPIGFVSRPNNCLDEIVHILNRCSAGSSQQIARRHKSGLNQAHDPEGLSGRVYMSFYLDLQLARDIASQRPSTKYSSFRPLLVFLTVIPNACAMTSVRASDHHQITIQQKCKASSLT